MSNKPPIEIHIKIPAEQHEFLSKFKKDHNVNMQTFIIKAISERINKLKQ